MAAFQSVKFSWRPGFAYKVPAETVGGVLEYIEKRDGSVTSETFLDYSRPVEAETHSMFEWDDSVAAEKFRLGQAARIINQLDVQIVEVGTETEEMTLHVVPAFVNTEGKKAGTPASFLNIVGAMGDDGRRAQVLKNAMRELAAFRKKYSALSEFAGLFSAIDALEMEAV